MPRLRVLAGPSSDDLRPITVNDGTAHPVTSDTFEGRVAVFLRYDDEKGDSTTYFNGPGRENVTWSIQVQGRFLQPRPANSVVFGNTFERPFKLPVGSSAVMKFMHFVDPTLEQDLAGEQPWALSPFFCTIPHLQHSTVDASSSPSVWPQFPPDEPLHHDSCEALGAPPDRAGRREYFASNANETTVGPEDLLTGDFCHGRLSFPSLSLKIPGGVSFKMRKYWNGQRVHFVCCERSPIQPDGPLCGPGQPFWCVAFELDEGEGEDESGSVDEDAEAGNSA